MTPAARLSAAIELIDTIEAQRAPAAVFDGDAPEILRRGRNPVVHQDHRRAVPEDPFDRADQLGETPAHR